MTIHPPKATRKDDLLRLSARVELQGPLAGVPDHLWFEVPASYARYVDERPDAFVTALLLLAMKRGESIAVRGPLSPRLAYGLRTYQAAFHQWFPNRFTPVNITCEAYVPTPPAPDTAGLAFSGGADSFYTLRQHLPECEHLSGFQSTHALFAHGFDIKLSDTKTFDTAFAAYDQMMAHLGLNLIPLRTNVRAVTKDVNWHLSYGTALAAGALAVGGAFSKFYVPAGHTYRETYPTGADARTTPLLSTESLGFFYSGAGATRVEKLVALANWPETYDRLRVCWEHPNGLVNCCRCEKCVRTMIPLLLEGQLPAYSTFPYSIDQHHIRALQFKGAHTRIYARQLIEHARKTGRIDVARDLRQALARSQAARAKRHVRYRLRRLRTYLQRLL